MSLGGSLGLMYINLWETQSSDVIRDFDKPQFFEPSSNLIKLKVMAKKHYKLICDECDVCDVSEGLIKPYLFILIYQENPMLPMLQSKNFKVYYILTYITSLTCLTKPNEFILSV
jgi:hypothetical protein